MRTFSVLILLCLVGCSTTREITISTRPEDARLTIDGVDRGQGPIVERFVFANAEEQHRIVASKPGYQDAVITLTRDQDQPELVIDLKYPSRKITFRVEPTPAVISINGKAIEPSAVTQASKELEFTLDPRGNWTSYIVTAERTGFEPARQVVTWTDNKSAYNLQLQPMKKNLAIQTNPPGGDLEIDGVSVGRAPYAEEARPFAYEVDSEQHRPIKVRATKPGFDPVDYVIGWDAGKTDYTIDLAAKRKTVRIMTEPKVATVKIDNAEIKPDKDGLYSATLIFTPVNDQGDLKKYTASITKKTADSEWHPRELEIAFDDPQSDYVVTLKEILTRPVELMRLAPNRTDDGWQLEPKRFSTLAMKDVNEGRQSPSRLVQAEKGEYIDSVTVAPDGKKVLYVVLMPGADKDPVVSQIRAVNTSGIGGEEQLSDGKSLELHPTYMPDGSQIVYASNRAGKKMNIFSITLNGGVGTRQLTNDTTAHNLWPSVDSDPQPRIYYERLIDTRPDPRLYVDRIGGRETIDLPSSGTRPRIGPKNDQIAFTAINERTGKRDIYLMSDKGGVPVNITNSPDSDDFDPVWSSDGSKVAFVSDRSSHPETGKNYDIYILSVNKQEKPLQVTTNGSWDDSPSFSPTDDAIYFRSNRGGAWGVWRIALR